MEGWKDGRMEGWKDGRMEGWKDGQPRARARARKGKAPHLSVLTQTNLKFVKMNSMRDPFAVVLLVVDRVPRRANS